MTEGTMDTFIDKLAQKFTAQEIIKANMAAEAKENKRLKEQVELYENMIQEMKQLNFKNMESAQRVNQLAEDGCENLKKTVEEIKQNPLADKKYLEDLFTQVDDTLHKENVKVYRNVQAVINDGLKEQTDTLIVQQNKSAKKQGMFLKVMSILILIVVLADIALQVLRILGIL